MEGVHPPRLTRLLVAAALLAGAACSGDGEGSERAAEVDDHDGTAPTTTTAEPTTTTAEPTTTTTAAPRTTTAAKPSGPGPGDLARRARLEGLRRRSSAPAWPCPATTPTPPARRITLALARKPARTPAARIGSLLINPGGPGNSGVDALPAELRTLTAALQNRFDIVSWDPRGIAAQRPRPLLRPQRPARAAAAAAGPRSTRPDHERADQQALADAYRAAGEACLRWSGDLLRHVGTNSTAEDLERIRIALGEEKLTFIGHSAGTLLGAVYADRYPQRVRAFVLDGPIDPSLTLDQMTLAQAKGFEAALRSFFAWCDKTATCKWRPGQPRPDPGAARPHGPDPPGAAQGVAEPDRRRRHLRQRRDEPPHRPLQVAVAGRRPGRRRAGRRLAAGHAGQQLPERRGQQRRRRPPVDPLPRPPRTPGAVGLPVAGRGVEGAGAGVRPGVHLGGAVVRDVVGARRRSSRSPPGRPAPRRSWSWAPPATRPRPQAWAEALAGQFERGVLVLRQGADHVAYYYSACVRRLVDAYLVDGRPPASGTICALTLGTGSPLQVPGIQTGMAE